MSEWREVALGDVIELKRGYDLPSAERRPGSVPIISSSGESGLHCEAKVKGPGVVTGRYGTIGEVFLVESDFWPLNTSLYVRDFRGNDVRFVYYLLKTINWAQYNDKSGVPGINRNHVHEAKVKLPETGEQRAIAHVLGALDDKIKRNCLVNKSLEEVARALFKDWFVDFGPPRATLDESTLGVTAVGKAVMPREFDHSGLPLGWRNGFLSEIAESRNSGVLPSDVTPETPYIGLEHMPRRDIALGTWGEAGKVTSNKSRFTRGDILFGKLRPYFHKVGVAALDGICSTDIIVLGPKSQAWNAFVLMCVSSDAFVAYTDQTSNGTKMPRTSWEAMGRYSLTVPDAATAAAFNQLVQPSIDLILANIHESRALATLRDLLIPKLISGEVQVSEIEGVVGGAV